PAESRLNQLCNGEEGAELMTEQRPVLQGKLSEDRGQSILGE
ncbi:hypothetical protein chiPu_0027502, partial [Chiloscyllium punctatum]|nr:hypothetical protein [Chiloscyllium punctatum]